MPLLFLFVFSSPRGPKTGRAKLNTVRGQRASLLVRLGRSSRPPSPPPKSPSLPRPAFLACPCRKDPVPFPPCPPAASLPRTQSRKKRTAHPHPRRRRSHLVRKQDHEPLRRHRDAFSFGRPGPGSSASWTGSRETLPRGACYAARLRGERCRGVEKGGEWSGAEGAHHRPTLHPYAGGLFLIALRITKRYPFEPPTVRFVTPVHHPNVDSRGRICLDTLKSPPAGTWSPAVSLPSLLTTLRALLADPNPDDALAEEVAAEYKLRPAEFRRRAAELTAAEATEATASRARAGAGRTAASAGGGKEGERRSHRGRGSEREEGGGGAASDGAGGQGGGEEGRETAANLAPYIIHKLTHTHTQPYI